MQKRADFGLTHVKQLCEGFGIVAIARQRWFQLVHIRRQRGVHDGGRHGFFPEPMGLFKNARQVMLNLERRNQPLSQLLERIGSQDVRWSDVRKSGRDPGK